MRWRSLKRGSKMIHRLTVGTVIGTLYLSVLVIGPSAVGAVSPFLTVAPTTNLLNGEVLSVSGNGYSPNVVGGAVECSDVPGQPTIDVAGYPIDVSCDVPSSRAGGYPFNNPEPPFFSSTGSASLPFVVHTGVVGPPALGTDSAGKSSAADAADYPCPPTTAQQTDGYTCVLTLGDSNDNSASIPLSFASPITPSPSVNVNPSSGLSSGQEVRVEASGYTPGSAALVIECNVTPGEPTGGGPNDNLPVGCDQATSVPTVDDESFPTTSLVNGSGGLSAPIQIVEGNVGETAQSAEYPCPPTSANIAAGGSCAIVVEDGSGAQSDAPISITGLVPQPTITVTPSQGLVGGAVTEITATNFVPNQLAGALECNSTPGQPTVDFAGVAEVDVSCSPPQEQSTGTNGTFSMSFHVSEGVTGPPQGGIDSAGNQAAVDAANYPCPPTPAQQAAGHYCSISVGDQAGDVTHVPISFLSVAQQLSAPIVAVPQLLSAPIVAMAAVPQGSGYWLFAADGGVFALGAAQFHGSMGGQVLDRPVVGGAATSDGGGYWLVASDGGVFSFGDAPYLGSMGGQRLNAPIVGITATPDGGFWLVASDGGVFSFGDASFEGSLAGTSPGQLIRGMSADASASGYWLVGAAGGVYTFGQAHYLGSLG
jgi:Neocarzinostatin family